MAKLTAAQRRALKYSQLAKGQAPRAQATVFAKTSHFFKGGK